jgi:hypothetical protein
MELLRRPDLIKKHGDQSKKPKVQRSTEAFSNKALGKVIRPGAQPESFFLSNEKDVVIFAAQKSDRMIAELKGKGYRGLENEEKLNDLLSRQDYISILKYVWTEPDLDKKISWLQKQAEKGHIILMFELSSALLLKKPQTDELISEAMAWFLRGRFCGILDVACHGDLSTRAAIDMLTTTYTLEGKIPPEKKALFKDLHRAAFYEKWEPKKDHPSPEWLKYHGMAWFSGENKTKPSGEWLSCRLQKRGEFLLQLMQHTPISAD